MEMERPAAHAGSVAGDLESGGPVSPTFPSSIVVAAGPESRNDSSRSPQEVERREGETIGDG